MATSLPDAAAGGFDRLYGGVLTGVAAGLVTAEVPVREALLGPSGELHGGVYAALAESAALAGTRCAIPAGDGSSARAIANVLSLLAPVLQGAVHARAVRRHAGRTTSVWEVEMTDDGGRRCAVARVTVAVGD